MDLIFVYYEMVVMGNEIYAQISFFYDKFVYDNEVGFHIDLQIINICHKLYIYQQVIIFHHYY
jgi:hypothetical protein